MTEREPLYALQFATINELHTLLVQCNKRITKLPYGGTERAVLVALRYKIYAAMEHYQRRKRQ